MLQYKTRICIANIDGSGLQIIPGWNDYMWSHFGWHGDNSFSIYSYKRPALYKSFDVKTTSNIRSRRTSAKKAIHAIALAVKNMIPRKFITSVLANNTFYQHYIINEEGFFFLESQWIKPYFNVDGHPSFTSDGKYMLTDSYPDENNNRRYIVYNTENQKGLVIAYMPENHLAGNSACDLHPKLSHDNKYIVFDTTSSAKHSMMLFELNWELIEKELA